MPDPAKPQSVQSRDAGWPMLFVLALLALSMAALAGYLGARVAMGPMFKALASRPPVLVLDIEQALRQSAPQRDDTILRRYAEQARRLAGQGYLVLEQQAVWAAPDPVYFPNDEELPR